MNSTSFFKFQLLRHHSTYPAGSRPFPPHHGAAAVFRILGTHHFDEFCRHCPTREPTVHPGFFGIFCIVNLAHKYAGISRPDFVRSTTSRHFTVRAPHCWGSLVSLLLSHLSCSGPTSTPTIPDALDPRIIQGGSRQTKKKKQSNVDLWPSLRSIGPTTRPNTTSVVVHG